MHTQRRHIQNFSRHDADYGKSLRLAHFLIVIAKYKQSELCRLYEHFLKTCKDLVDYFTSVYLSKPILAYPNYPDGLSS